MMIHIEPSNFFVGFSEGSSQVEIWLSRIKIEHDNMCWIIYMIYVLYTM